VNNPAFIYVPPSALSPESPPRTPSRTGENFQAPDFPDHQDFVFPNPHALNFPPSTPANVDDMPAYELPTRVQWVKKGGVHQQNDKPLSQHLKQLETIEGLVSA
jgi:hypothetical protein